ncbi:MAG: flagellar type III secretion system protein FlhB [Chromatiales bacterium]|nr:flagellar type III secretion system protein FlhB [Chromatiales bacterium]
MAEPDSGQERTEEPTQKKRDDARKKGQVARSRELNTWIMMLASAGGMLTLGGPLVEGVVKILEQGLTIERGMMFEPRLIITQFDRLIIDGLKALFPFFGLMLLAAIVGPLLMGGGNFSTEAMAPKFSKLNPIKGLGRIFSLKGLMELVKSLAKFLLIGSIGVAWLWYERDIFLGLGDEPLEQALLHTAWLLGWGFLVLAASLLFLVAIDVPFQLWDHQRQLRMTRQEVRDEMKNTEGRPEVKGRIRQMQREIAMRRMMEQVPKADVVVTNPTHFAVALRYDPDTMSAPVVIAKGADLIAGQIRSVARHNDIVILSAPLLARALYYSTKLDKEIPAELYVAVAQVLAYVFQLRAVRLHGGDIPTAPTDLPVPDSMYTGPG